MAPKSPKAAPKAAPAAPAAGAPGSPPGSPKKQYRKPIPMDPISANKVWKEHCDKCDALETKTGPFQVDARTMFTITEKPTRVTPNIKVTKKEYEEALKLMADLAPIKNTDKPPPEKYELPLTVAQEYGWYSKPLIPKISLFEFPRHACEITEYADIYYMSQGRNPFARKPPIAGQGGKGKDAIKDSKGAKEKSPPKAPPAKK